MKPEDFASGDTMDASDESLAPRRPARVTGPNAPYEKFLTVDPSHYAISTELARGGMGRIVRAYDRRLGRPVAIKELLTGHDDIRFEREARITARLAHPAIVAIHEAGRWPTGEPFFAMKLVAGTSLDKRISDLKTFAARLALIPSVTAVVEALAYAHSERVIHRDLKPANVLVGNYGETVVIDWGLAKDLSTPDDDVAVGPYRGGEVDGETIAGAVMGTPAYMPPEQADGARVDERADVYALGALLYQVLSGVPPYEGKTSADVLQRVLAGPPKPLAQLVPQAPVELVAIADKAMARDPKDRFPSAQEMADELRRFQTGQLVTSHRYTAGELVRRWLRKYRAPVAVGAIAFVTLAIVGVVSVAKIVSETHRADREAADARARADRGTLEHARALLDTDPTQALVALTELSPNAPEWRAAQTVVADAEARGVAHVYHSNGDAIQQLAFSADGAYLAAITDLGLIVWDVATGVSARQFGVFQTIAWDGHDLVNISGEDLSRWRVFAGGNEKVTTYADDVDDARLSPTARYLAAHENIDGESKLEIIDLVTKQQYVVKFDTFKFHEFDGGELTWLDDHLLAVWDDRHMNLIVESARLRKHDEDPIPVADNTEGNPIVAVAAGGDHLYIAHNSSTLMHAGGGKVQTGHKTRVSSIVVLPDGRVATASLISGKHAESAAVLESADLAVTIADGTRDVVRLLGHRASIAALAVSPSGRLASGDLSGEVRVWLRTPIETKRDSQAVSNAFLEPDRAGLIELRDRGDASRTDLVTGKNKSIDHRIWITDPPEPGNESELATVMFVHAKHALRWLTIDQLSGAWSWDFTTGARQICEEKACETAFLVAISGDGKVGVVSNPLIATFDAVTGAFHARTGQPLAAAVSENGKLVAASQSNTMNNLALFTPPDGEDISLTNCHSAPTALAFSTDGRTLAAADDTAIELIGLTAPYPTIRQLTGHEGMITSLEFLDDGRLVSFGIDHTVRIWNVTDGSSHTLQIPARITSVDVLGNTAVTSSDDHVLRVWDIDSESSRPLPGHDAPPVFGGITAEGKLVGVDHDGRISLYQPTRQFGEAALRTWIAALTNL